MLGLIERNAKNAAKLDKYGSGAVELPDYPGSINKTYRLVYPKYLPAPHLAPLLRAFTRAKEGEPIRCCFSYPPRAGKTESVIAGFVDRLLFNPESRLAYITYAGKFSQKKSARIRSLARNAGVPIDPSTRSKQDWATGINEGGVWATSVGGQINGMGFDLEVFDDLLAGREEAESVHARDRAWDMLKADGLTRLEPDGGMILNGTRWHEDDPIGRAVSEGGWEEVNIPALDEHGNSYWPKRWTTGKLLNLQRELGGEDGYDWCALYMGKPRSKGSRVFHPAQMVDALPPGPARVGIGVDFAYTVNKSSDFSSAVVMAEIGGQYFVVDVYRGRVPEAEFRAVVADLAERYSAQFVVGYIARTEQANITLLQRDNLPAFAEYAIKDKKVHALPTAAGWNIGRLKVLRGRVWEKPFTREVEWFTGADRRDDQVDALCTVYNAMYQSAPIDWDFVQQMQDAAPTAYAGLSN